MAIPGFSFQKAELQLLPATDLSLLPSKDSPDLQLVQISGSDVVQALLNNGESWRGVLPIEAYVRRDQYLSSVELTANGRIMWWALIYLGNREHPRTCLATCETYHKRGLVARPGHGVEEITVYGIGSVYCRKEYRGMGYAGRMMNDLGKKLEDWQKERGQTVGFNALYSDIGKIFYARYGWMPFASNHITFAVRPTKEFPGLSLPATRELLARDLLELCQLDESLLRESMKEFSDLEHSTSLQVAFVPTVETMRWHHAREDFIAKELSIGPLDVKGAMARIESNGVAEDNGCVWCIWTRVWGDGPPSLQIIRLVVLPSGTESTTVLVDRKMSESHIRAVASVLCAAENQAAKDGMKSVEIWNPSALVEKAAQRFHPESMLVIREKNNIASLRWYGPEDISQVDWIANERYAWA